MNGYKRARFIKITFLGVYSLFKKSKMQYIQLGGLPSNMKISKHQICDLNTNNFKTSILQFLSKFWIVRPILEQRAIRS